MKLLTLSALYIVLSLSACSEIPTIEYKDNSYLEAPPGYKVKKTNSAKSTTKVSEQKGLGGLVSLADDADQVTLVIDKKFDRAWIVVDKALVLNGLEITDRNRDEGIFHVDYDPDKASGDYAAVTSFFLFSDEYEKSSYKLKLVEKDNKIEVTANIKAPVIDSSLYEDEEDREQPKDASSKLIETLFKTIRDDLPDEY